ncbi:MAG: GAF domain-containing protein, partial [Gemmatimonadaceae bacterium]
FSDGDAAFISRLADLGSLAVQNAWLLARERQSSRESSLLAEIVQQLNQSLEFERVTNLVAEKSAELLGARSAVLTLIDREEVYVAATSGTADLLTKQRAPLAGSFAYEVATSRRVLRTRDLRPISANAALAASLDDRPTNGIAAPLMVADRAIGALMVAANPGRDFTERDEELLRSLATHAAVAIENARLYRAAAHTARHAETLSSAARSLAQSVDASSFFDELSRVARDLLTATGLTVYSVDTSARVVRIAYLAGVGADTLAQLVPQAVEDPSIAGLLLAGAEAFYEDVRSSDAVTIWNRSPGTPIPTEVVSLARLPLVVEGRLRGALTLRWRTAHAFPEDERMLLRDFATQVALALRNAELISALDRRAKRFSAVARMQQVTSRVALRDVFSEVRDSARTAAPQAQAVALFRVVEGQLLAPQFIDTGSAASWGGEEPMDMPLDCAAVRSLRSRQPVMSGRPLPLQTTAGQPTNMRSELAVPLLHGDVPRGVLLVQSPEAGAFSDEDAEVLSLLARQAAGAVENAEQFENERRSREIAEAAAIIARSALGAANSSHTATLALEAIDRAVPSPGKAIAFVDGSGTSLRYLAASGTLEGLRHLSITLENSAASLTGQLPSLRVNAASLAGVAEGRIVPSGCTIIPLIAKQRLLGVLWVVPSAAGLAAEHELDTLRNLAAPLALAADVLLLNEEEQQRRAREHMLATALATMDQAVLIIGLDRRVLYANAAAVTEYEYPIEVFQALPFERLIDSAAVARRVGSESTTEATGIWEAEHIHRRRDGSTFPASVLLSYIRDADNVPVGQVVTVRNLTEERRIEEQLRQSEKLAALGELVAGVAHELNNPLAGISAFAQLLMEDELNEEQHESVRLIKREADRAVGVIRDLLLFSRKTGPSQTLVDVNEMIELTLRLRGYGLRSAGIDVRVELEPSIPRVAGDSQRLQQVLLNLIINAEYALHRADAKRLVVKSERTRDGVAFIVIDSGAGMDEETRQRIFEPFFTTKPAGEGTGLGLSVSYGIVRAHGGFISVESTPGRGTTFRVELPQAREQAALASA